MCKCSYKSPEGEPCQFIAANILDDLLPKIVSNLEHNSQTKALSKDVEFQYHWKNKPFCLFHFPMEGKDQWGTKERFIFFQTYNLALQSYTNFQGTSFPEAHKLGASKKLRYSINPQKKKSINLRNCTFGVGVSIDLSRNNDTETDLSNSEFLGKIKTPGEIYNTSFKSCHFHDDFTIPDSGQIFNTSFDNAIFEQIVDFRRRRFSGNSTFKMTRFNGPARFEDCSLSQGIDFTGARFGKGAIKPELEPSFRTIRKAMGENKNHPMEGKFYALEQRCNRKKYPWYSPTKWFSCLYDWTSEYGTSPGRAGLVLLLLQAPFWIIYRKILPKNYPLGPSEFTFAQIFKPFELFSYKSVTYEPVQSLIENSPSLPFITSLHSILTFSLFAIFLLALRWRFRKG